MLVIPEIGITDNTAGMRDRQGHLHALVQFTVDSGQVVRRHEVPASTGSAGPSAPLCFRGTELIWRDGDGHVYTRAYPGAPDVALNLPSGNFRAPGCWPDL